MRISDWSSDVCSSDLIGDRAIFLWRFDGDDDSRQSRAGAMGCPSRWSKQILFDGLRLGRHWRVIRGAVVVDPPAGNTGSWNHRQCRDHWRGGRSEEHTSELQSLMRISYAVFCLKTKKIT